MVVIKLDGERPSDGFTVVIRGTALGDGAWVRRDAADVGTALVGALVDFLRSGRYVRAQAQADAQAIVDEHDETPR